MSLKSINKLPVLNAKHSLELHITTTDCTRAEVKDPARCAAALAIRREFHPIDVRVHLGRVYVRQNNSNWQRYLTPKSLRTELIAFDRGGTFTPGTYTLPAPPKSRKTNKRQGTHSRFKKGRPDHHRRPPTIVQNVRSGPAQGDLS